MRAVSGGADSCTVVNSSLDGFGRVEDTGVQVPGTVGSCGVTEDAPA
jgi:hypothetical protein